MSEQPYRECLAAPLALEAAAQVLDLRGRIGLLRNDAEAAIAALRKGSTQSGPMQRSALRAFACARGWTWTCCCGMCQGCSWWRKGWMGPHAGVGT